MRSCDHNGPSINVFYKLLFSYVLTCIIFYKYETYSWLKNVFVKFGKLDKAHKEVIFNPKETELSHSLLLKRIILGPCKDAECELNTIEIETTGYQNEDVKGTIAILYPSKETRCDMASLELMIPKTKVKLRLQEGSGPITIYGHHITGLPDDDIVENEEIEEESIETKVKKGPPDMSDKLSKKRKFSKSDELPKKVPKMDIDEDDDDYEEEEEEEDEHDYEEEEEEDDDDDDDYYELPEKTKKKIETPAKKLKNTPFKIKDKKEKKKKK